MKAAESKTTKPHYNSSLSFFDKHGMYASGKKEYFFSPGVVQTKLNIGHSNDKYEIEADNVADKVINKVQSKQINSNNSPFFSPATVLLKKSERVLQDQSETEDIQEKPIAQTITPVVQLEQADENEEMIQEKCSECTEQEHDVQTKLNGESKTNSSIEKLLLNSRGAGSKLDDRTRSTMEQGFGVDFSKVRIHTTSVSESMNKDLGARAFTNENDIFFNRGEFSPQSRVGQTLLAHELTHTIQQGASVRMKQHLQRKDDEVDMEELRRQIEISNQEQRDAYDPSEANKTLKDAVKKGTQAELLANSLLAQIEPTIPEPMPEDGNTNGSRVSTPIINVPDVVVPSSQKKQDSDPINESISSESDSHSSTADSAIPNKHIATTETPNIGRGSSNTNSSPSGTENEPKTETEVSETLKFLEQESAGICNKGAKKTQKLADNESAHDTAKEKAGQTKVAVEPPELEGQSRGNANQVNKLDGAEAPKASDNEIKHEMNKAISDAIPKKLEELNEFESEKKAQVIGNKVLASTTKQVGEVKGTYNEIEQKAETTESDIPKPLPEIEHAPNTSNLNLGKGAVPSVPQEQTDLSSFEEEADSIYEKEGISVDMQAEFKKVDSGDIAEANKEKVILKEKVANEPANLQAFVNEKQIKVEKGLQNEEERVRDSMKDNRKKELDGAKDKQVKTKTEMEKKREAVTIWINERYTKAKDLVTIKLDTLESQALKLFDNGQSMHSKQFEKNVKRRVNAWKSDRYSGFWGGAKWLKDKFVGIDHFKEIKQIFTTERATFVTAIDLLILNINTENERTIQSCKTEIREAKTDIQKFISELGPELKDVGNKAQEEITKKLDALDRHIEKEKKKLQQKLCDQKDEAIKAIDRKIEEMKAEMSGLVGKIGALLLYAAKKFFKWVIEKIGGNADKIISLLDKGATVLKSLFTNPIGFFKNLVNAVGGGIKGFVTNIVSWLKKGLMEWLLGQMGDSGLELPKKFDIKGIMFLGLQVAGLTWRSIRRRIVKSIGKNGEEIMTKAEQSVDIIKRVVKEGPIALWEIIKEKAVEIKTSVIKGINEWVITKIIKKMSVKLLTMLNPAGAIVQAIMFLYDVVMFFIENWNRLIDFVKSVFDSIGAIASGAIGKAASFIENTLGRTIPIILSFAARFVGLDGIGKAIRKIIETIQKPFKKILDKMVSFIIKRLKKTFDKVKILAKKVIAKLLNWWKTKKIFKAEDGKTHSLYFKGDGSSAILTVASNPTPFSTFIDSIKVGNDNEKKEAKKKAKAIATTIDETKREKNAGSTEIEKNKNAEKKSNKINKLVKNLSKYAKSLFGLPSSELPETKFDNKASVIGGDIMATSMVATPLTKKGASGSIPTKRNHTVFNKLLKRRKGGGSYYKRGHMLNDNAHGPGTWENMTPLSTKGNSNHESQVESLVKAALSSGAMIKYTVKAEYGRGSLNIPRNTNSKIKEIRDAEQFVPKKLKCKAILLAKDGEKFKEKQNIVKKDVDNPIDTGLDSYELTSEIKERVVITIDSVTKIHNNVSGLNKKEVKSIQNAAKSIPDLNFYQQIKDKFPKNKLMQTKIEKLKELSNVVLK